LIKNYSALVSHFPPSQFVFPIGSGVFKEFLDDLIKDGFASRNDREKDGGAPQLFSVTPKQELIVNLDLAEDRSMLVHYAFLGRVLGKAIYESILVEPQFCLPFLNQLMGKLNTIEDLKNYDDVYYSNLNKLRYFNEEEINNLGLFFELNVPGNSSARTVELVSSGRSLPVNKGNVFQYTQAVA
jgi:ubiquitin-protein ligase E3 C